MAKKIVMPQGIGLPITWDKIPVGFTEADLQSLDYKKPWPRVDPERAKELWHDDHRAAYALFWRCEMQRRAVRMNWLKEDPLRQAADKARCKNVTKYWMDHYGWIQDFDAESSRRRCPFVMWPAQVKFLKWAKNRIKFGQRSLCGAKPRKIGVTWLCLHGLIVWPFLFQDSFSALLGSRSGDAVDTRGDMGSLFEKIRWILRQQPPWLLPGGELAWSDRDGGAHGIDKSMALVNYDNDSAILGEKVTPVFGQGKRNNLIFIDEFAAIDPATASGMWLATESAGALLLIWNAGQSYGHIAHRLLHGSERYPAAPKEMIFRFNEWADPTRNPKTFKKERVAEIGADAYALAYEGKTGAMTAGRVLDVDIDDITVGNSFLAKIPCPWRGEVAGAELTEEEQRARGHYAFRFVAPVLNLWDFGSGAQSLLVSLFALIDIWTDPEKPRLIFDNGQEWLQTAASSAGADWQDQRIEYGNEPLCSGDPAGRQRDAEQSSWESRLQAAGVPILVFDPDEGVNSREWKHAAVLKWTELANDGRLFIHERCTYLKKCVELWTWRGLRRGEDMLYVDKALWMPAKDNWGHGGDTMLYTIEAFTRFQMSPGGHIRRKSQTTLPPSFFGATRRRSEALRAAIW